MLRDNPFRRPFPDRDFDRAQVAGLGRIAVFVAVFLYLFRPFGRGHVSNLWAICLGYGLVTFTVAVAYHYVTDRWLGWRRSGERWTLGRWLLDCGLLLFFIALGNFLFYNALVGWTLLDPVVFLAVAGPTVLVGLFPIAFSGLAIQLRAEREHQHTAAGVAARPPAPFRPRTERPVALADDLTVAPADVLFCEARRNYVRVVYDTGATATERTVRTTLAAVAEQLGAERVLRCHRSFLVNADRVVAATGNAQGLQLRLAGWAESVPVSRTFVPRLREVLDVRP